MIDLESFQTIDLDKTSGVVKVGGGVRLGNLADGIWTQGERALSHGTCKSNPHLVSDIYTDILQVPASA